MENYKKSLCKRIVLFSILVIVSVLIMIASYCGVFGSLGNGDFNDGALAGFQSGLLFGFSVLFIIQIVRYVYVMKDATRLKQQYNKENDERKKEIKQKAGGNVILINSTVIILAAIIAGYYNKTVFYSLVACALFQLSLCSIVKLYYLKKY